MLHPHSILFPRLSGSYSTNISPYEETYVFSKSLHVVPCLFLEKMSTVDHSNRFFLVKQVASLCKQADDVYADETLRVALLQATKQLAVALEKPTDAVYQNAFLVTLPFAFLYSQSMSRE